MNFPCLRSRLKIWCCEMSSTASSRVSTPILDTQAGPGSYSRAPLLPPAFRNGVASSPSNFIRSVPNHQVARLRPDGVDRRESADIWPVILKVARLTLGCCLLIFSLKPVDQSTCAPFSPHPRDQTNIQARTEKSKINFPCSTDYEHDWQSYTVVSN